MSNHIKFKGQIISHCILKVFLRRDFIIEIVERMQPFILCLYSGFHTEFCFSLYASEPHVKQMLTLIFSTGSFFQSDMLAYNKPVILEIDEFTFMVFVMRYASSKYSNTWICSYAVERIFVECDNTFQRMMFEYVVFDILFLFTLSRY